MGCFLLILEIAVPMKQFCEVRAGKFKVFVGWDAERVLGDDVNRRHFV